MSLNSNTSYRFIDGTFYTQDWLALFTPLDYRGESAFRKHVNELEKSLGRRANKNELRRIALLVERAGL